MGVLSREDVRKVSVAELIAIVAPFKGQIDKVYWHWTAGRYGQFWSDYHINIDADGSIYLTTEDLSETLAHTWHRNSGAIGVGCLCMMNANMEDFGEMPLTLEQVEASARVFAALSIALNLPLDSLHFRTHAEQAIDDDYGPGSGDPETRWDGYILAPGDDMGSGGNILRGKGNWYLNDYQQKIWKGEEL